MKTVAATLFFGLLAAQSAMAAECSSYSGYERVNNDSAARQAGPVPVFQLSYQLSFLQSSYQRGDKYAAAAQAGAVRESPGTRRQ
jgi:hypothetical protein